MPKMIAMPEVVSLNFCKMHGRQVKTPQRAHMTDAGIDIFAPLDMEEVVIEAQHDIIIKTGLRVGVPAGYALIVKNKSGVATKKKLVCGACVIDAGYTGELMIHLINAGHDATKIAPGDKITQVILMPIETPAVNMISENEYMMYYEGVERGEAGFGSTGSR